MRVMILTCLMLPLTTVGSVALVALMLALLALCSPAVIFGATLMAAGKLATKFTEWCYPDMNTSLKDPGKGPLITSLSTTVLLFPLLIAPVTASSAVLAALTSVLLVPSLAVLGAYDLSNKIINRFSSGSASTPKEAQINHSYGMFPQNASRKPETTITNFLSEVPYFGALFQSKPATKKHPHSVDKEFIEEETIQNVTSFRDNLR